MTAIQTHKCILYPHRDTITVVCTWTHTNRHTETKTHREIEDREIGGKRQIDTSTYIYIGTHTETYTSKFINKYKYVNFIYFSS